MGDSQQQAPAQVQVQAQSGAVDEKKKADVQRLRALLGSGLDQSGWDKAWQDGITPWDSGGNIQPTLVSFVHDTPPGQQHILHGPKGKVLVPGCGTGYDVEFFASLGYSPVLGVDISPAATQAAQNWRDALLPRPAHYDSIQFKTADFLEDDNGEVGRDYTLAFDYTLFCALSPSLRTKWADAYARSIKPGGLLLTLVFPIEGDRPGGPPYSVSPVLITSHLASAFDLVWRGVPPGQPERRKGIEEVMLWRRR